MATVTATRHVRDWVKHLEEHLRDNKGVLSQNDMLQKLDSIETVLHRKLTLMI